VGLRVKAPDTVPDVEAGVYHRSVEEEPDNGLVIDHDVPASSQTTCDCVDDSVTE